MNSINLRILSRIRSDAFAQEVLKDLDLSKLRVPDGDDAYNIVIVGETGTGKSYFANGLLGSLNPGRDGNEFSVRGGQVEVENSIKYI